MASRANNRVRSTASESIYTGLEYSDRDMYSTVTPAPIKNRGAKRTAKDEPSPSYRRTAMCLGLLCAVLVACIVALVVYYILSSRSRTACLSQSSPGKASGLNLSQIKCSSLTACREQLHREREKLLDQVVELSKQTAPLDYFCSVASNRTSEVVCTDCPQNWLQFNSKYYYISEDYETWNNSRSDCQKRGGDLVVIDSSLEQIFIWSHTGGNYWDQYWIGVTDAKREGTWLWVDDTQLTGGYWMDGQPDNFNLSEDCAATFTTVNALKSWNDVECQNSLRWICEANTLPLSP
nr:PREDICTED: C-type lectin domain family 4 member M-like isoform X1 [Lepisosteus oculatus]